MVIPNSSHELNDDALAEDIDLLADVVVAATGVECALTPDEVDQALGLVAAGVACQGTRRANPRSCCGS